MQAVIIRKVSFFAVTILILFSFHLACSEQTEQHSDTRGLSSCLRQITGSSLRQAAREFVKADLNRRLRMLEEYNTALNLHSVPKDHRLTRLLDYFADITVNTKSKVSGRHIPMSYTDIAQIIETQNIPPAQAPTWDTIKEPLWSTYPIPEHLMVEDYPVFRGDRSLVGRLDPNELILGPYSPIWDRLKKLFSQGTSTKDRPLTDSWHQDVFEHTADSQGSPFLGSSTDFIIARRFGKKPSNSWSAIIEFRGNGIDVNATGKYFEKLDFLLPGKAMIPMEMEIAINRGIPAHAIRGVWFVEQSGLMYFVQNPNYMEKFDN